MHQTASKQTSVYFITKSSSLKQNQNQKPSLQEQPPKVFFAEATTKGKEASSFLPLLLKKSFEILSWTWV
jgi:hypothetical protein